MRLWRRAGHRADGAQEGLDPGMCEHAWRIRHESVALTGHYVCEVCDRCGALRIHGPEEITGPATRVHDDVAIHLETLARRSSHGLPPPVPPD